jgi:hypothetical protein
MPDHSPADLKNSYERLFLLMLNPKSQQLLIRRRHRRIVAHKEIDDVCLAFGFAPAWQIHAGGNCSQLRNLEALKLLC